MQKSKSSQSGFTLFEIAVSIAILGVALTALLGLQTSIVDRYSRENTLFHATLYAQYIMSTIEADNDDRLLDRSGTLSSYLTDLGYFDDSLTQQSSKLEGWEFDQKVEPIEIPGQEDEGEVMDRIDLSISWGESEDATYKLVFYRKKKKQGSTNSDSVFQ